MLTIDAWLLTRVFQPIVDWLSPWCSRFYAARCCVYAAGVLAMEEPLHYAAAQEWTLCAMITLSVGMLAYWWRMHVRIWQLQEELEEMGHFPPRFFHDTIIRILYTLLFLTGLPLMMLPPIELVRFAQPFAFGACAVGMYFAGCNPGTPRPRHVMRWAEA